MHITLTFMDFVFLLLGGYIGFVATNYFFWRTAKHCLFSQISLLTALLSRESPEIVGAPYPLNRQLENNALSLLYHGHNQAFDECRSVANEMEDVFDRLRSKFNVANELYIDVGIYKTKWLTIISSLRPNWASFFWINSRAEEVLKAYLAKEVVYVTRRKTNLKHHRKTILCIEDI